MYNWSVDEDRLKEYPEQYNIWKLEQLINFGLGKEKISKRLLEKYLDKLYIDEDKRSFLKFLLNN